MNPLVKGLSIDYAKDEIRGDEGVERVWCVCLN